MFELSTDAQPITATERLRSLEYDLHDMIKIIRCTPDRQPLPAEVRTAVMDQLRVILVHVALVQKAIDHER